MAVVARQLATDDFAVFTVAWSLIYTISGAVLSSAEPELTRMMISSQWRSTRKILVRAGILIPLSTATFAIATRVQMDEADLSILALLLVTILLLIMLLEVLARSGLASLRKRFEFGLVAPSDAILRLLFLGSFFLFVNKLTVELTLLAMLLGTLSISLIYNCLTFTIGQRVLSHADEEVEFVSARRFGYGYLLIATISMTSLVSGVPMIAGIASSLTSSELGLLGAALLIARVPLILIMGFESVLVQEFDARIRRSNSAKKLGLILSGVALLSSIGGFAVGYALGSVLVEIIAGPSFVVGNLEMGLFGSSIGLLSGGILLTPLNIALGHHPRIAGVWASMLVLFVLMLSQFGSNLTTIGVCLTVSSFLALGGLSISAVTMKRETLQGTI